MIAMCSNQCDPDSFVIACVWPEGVEWLPLFHNAFSLLDLLFFGTVRLTRDGSGLHHYTDTDNLIGRWGKYFAEGRACNIDDLQ
jgi:hypothetical protein